MAACALGQTVGSVLRSQTRQTGIDKCLRMLAYSPNPGLHAFGPSTLQALPVQSLYMICIISLESHSVFGLMLMSKVKRSARCDMWPPSAASRHACCTTSSSVRSELVSCQCHSCICRSGGVHAAGCGHLWQHCCLPAAAL